MGPEQGRRGQRQPPFRNSPCPCTRFPLGRGHRCLALNDSCQASCRLTGSAGVQEPWTPNSRDPGGGGVTSACAPRGCFCAGSTGQGLQFCGESRESQEFWNVLRREAREAHLHRGTDTEGDGDSDRHRPLEAGFAGTKVGAHIGVFCTFTRGSFPVSRGVRPDGVSQSQGTPSPVLGPPPAAPVVT